MAERFVVTGGNRLSGEVAVGGAKNSVLKLMAATLLAEGTSTITNCPDILDVPLMAEVLRGLGATVELDGDVARITSPDEPKYDADFAAVRQFRASVCVLGPLVGRCKRARVALPGGDAIGSRPLDMHQAGLRQLGAQCNIEHGCVVAQADTLRGAEIQLEFPSVGATENILMAAVVAEGVTTIHNAAREPDVVDLCTMLNQMGARIEGAGSPTMTITGVPKLHPTEHRVIGDRIVAATWGIAAAITRGDITVTGIDPGHLQVVLHKLHDAGATVTQTDDSFRVTQYERPKAVNVATLPYPGFPTDLQPMAIALASIADGTSMITENVFEARFRFVEEMIRLGADARTDGHHAVVRGLPQLSSAPVWCSDIRAGAGLVLAGLVADGDTEVHDVFHIDRGYPLFVENLTILGAEIERVQ
ncbi:UDP-N-acetylglucosamine 1-carboxyvinyltransferase [Mycobacterium mantenii]|uniref:UDP-N-acetylglucosamine 1-carboxyvinyltransferase n=1 Tax=Mycobacterium mantenii TaxID=560555 RepID=A0A1A2T1N2_MYCNT|nr:UDP-N-acetylglucosamine 1-carboxyvinyltransferase [Mycobacterium mantenii]MCV7243240.1 UDP-N-acetylglucosamine 1-carboxyvinyltransferase [Mycobacterium mantenii]OBH43903.1 UDP-N-acetylglucosamine 1-carboxyvinyltransferase [Mycobacterium mantenii]OBH57341.1 UDP-N-acetylglucosamine 1-carboxyvinyltransferase [Mycobacterium mantenii]OBH69947.1 UDP-N-acetylglucosamine 1-carboxyvinyltransferase [Mycobacterium mantenii]OBH70781.1 UDP-N-acetylglucosamine 1-carboxyvinyltransferase [Mycobacterium man